MICKENDEWKKHLNACIESDPDKIWIDLDSIPKRAYQNTLEILKAYQKAIDKNVKEIKNELRQEELERVSQNRYALIPLLRLSLMTKKTEKRHHYLMSAKNIDENFAATEEWLDCLKSDGAISKETHEKMAEDIKTLRSF
jgi:hypothetical protein